MGVRGVFTRISIVLWMCVFVVGIQGQEKDKEAYRLQSYNQLLKILEDNQILLSEDDYNKRTQYQVDILMDAVTAVPAPANTESLKAATGGTEAQNGDYSTTNVQVAGVDEGDRIKTDGKYLYISRGKEVAIVSPSNTSQNVLATIKGGEYSQFQELYLRGNQLIIVGQEYSPVVNPYAKKERTYYDRPNLTMTKVWIYNIANKELPTLQREIGVQGNLLSTRMTHNGLYLVTNSAIYEGIKGEVTPQEVLPTYTDNLFSKEVQTLSPDRIMCYPWSKPYQYTTVTGIALDKDEPISQEAVLGRGEEIYLSPTNLYVTSGDYGVDESSDLYSTYTHIGRYSLKEGSVKWEAVGKVKGHLLNQFSMDEYKGYFRIATTEPVDQESSVCILDTDLKQVGEVTGLAKGEKIYAVRFAGDTGYVVTFKEIDPLFVIDLKNPKAPKVQGELKIPGFSNYLHPINDHTLLGIGRSTADLILRDEKGKEEVVGTRAAGIKLSLFDVSNPQKPRELSYMIVGDSNSYSGALDNHKMICYDASNKLFMFPMTLSKEETKGTQTWEQGAMIVKVGDQKLTKQAFLTNPNKGDGMMGSDDRIVTIGNQIYYLQDGELVVYHKSTFKYLKTISCFKS